MKHNIKITAILLVMFLVTQLIGLYVVSFYSPIKIVNGEKINVSSPELPFGLEPPAPEENKDFIETFISLIIAFIIAISILFILIKYKSELILKIWFTIVIIIALGVSFNSILSKLDYAIIISIVLALPLAFLKIYKLNLLVHNLTELFIYPGIAAVFVPILNIWTIIALLVLISAYDMWAVWHSGIMQKMAKYQIDKLKIFGGFFVPYLNKKQKASLKKSKTKKKKIKVNVAILGGGDVIFPIIAAGVMLKTLGLIPALLVTLGALIGLTTLFIFAEKKKFYPAMPFITAGIFLGMIAGWLIF